MEVLAPLSGVIIPLEQVPDPVFARKMVGDGAAIDPTSGRVVAPVAGVVTQLHEARHAVVITADNGVEILVHVGLDTVTLGGEGFRPLVAVGDRVARGAPLMELDLETIARQARSLMTEVVVASGDRVRSLEAASGRAEAGRTVLLRLELRDAAPVAAPSEEDGFVESGPVGVENRSGLHARPAALIAEEAKRFESEVRLVRGSDEANAKSLVALMGLSVKQGDEVRVRATGPDAEAAVAGVSALIASGFGDGLEDDPDERWAEPIDAASGTVVASKNELQGSPASPGIAIGRVCQHRHASLTVEQVAGSAGEERGKLRAAINEAARQLDSLRHHTEEPSRNALMGVQLSVLDDPDLMAAALAGIDEGESAAFAWHKAFTGHADHMGRLSSLRMRERAADLRDVGERVLALLTGAPREQIDVPEGTVLVADELTPSQVAAFDPKRIVGFCTTSGSSTSHVAILARAMGMPALCGIDDAALAVPDGTRVVVDGARGCLCVDPEETEVEALRERVGHEAAEVDAAVVMRPGRTSDGHHVEVVANVLGVADVRAALEAGAEGVGLMRSEFLFMDRTEPPSESEQAQVYRAVAEALGKKRRFVVRTLDAGGDKPIPYLPLEDEENPFLGMRGIRVSLATPDLFRAQLRAILSAAELGDVHVMFPMVSTLEELRAAKEILAEEQTRVARAVKVGIMIEVPSAAAIAELLAPEVDFFSIGTNDLTQYVLAMDRAHPKLGRQADPLQPAVLRMMALAVEGAHEHGKWVGVCGELASDPLAAPLLVGLGVDELSVSVPAIARIKMAVSRFSTRECSLLASDVLQLRTAADVRALLTEFASQAGVAPVKEARA